MRVNTLHQFYRILILKIFLSKKTKLAKKLNEQCLGIITTRSGSKGIKTKIFYFSIINHLYIILLILQKNFHF